MQLIESVEVTKPNGKTENSIPDRKDRFKNHKLTPTCICIDSKNRYAFTASKDGSIIKWCLETKKICAKLNSISRKEFDTDEELKKTRHHKHINCITISSDDKFLATGGWDKLVRIYSPKNLSWIHTFQKHRGEVTALGFRLNHPLLYSGSVDKSVMLWTLEDDDNRVFIDDLYGHESTITSLDILKRERVLTSGGRDQSIRIWKIVDQAQTVFESKHQSVDIARYIDEQTFVSGGEDGSISVWTTMKRQAIVNLQNAHPIKQKEGSRDANDRCLRYDGTGLKNWISAIATFSLKKVVQDPKKINQQTGKKKRKVQDGEELVTDGVEYDSDASSEDDDESVAEEQDTDVDDEPSINNSRELALVASGSCNSEVKIWKLIKSGSAYELNLHQTFECSGFINDLRFTSDGKRLLAVCGSEHKFGRWWRIPHVKSFMKVFDLVSE